MLLATDLDGTFLAGSPIQKYQLYQLIFNNPGISLVFVTGRGLHTVLPLLSDITIPTPAYIICDVGATIVNGHTLQPVKKLQEEIESGWPGHNRVMQALDDLKELEYQDVPQQRRCSFFTEDETVITEVKIRMKTLNCDVIYSRDRFLDILPKNVNKGSSLSKLVNLLDISPEEVLVAGDTLNDLSLYQCGYNGVVVGNSEEKLKLMTARMPQTFLANAEGAGGILEAFDFFQSHSLYS